MWRDAFAIHHWTTSAEDIEIAPTKTVGYVVSRDEDKIVVAFGEGLEGHMCVLAIPIECVTEVKELIPYGAFKD